MREPDWGVKCTNRQMHYESPKLGNRIASLHALRPVFACRGEGWRKAHLLYILRMYVRYWLIWRRGVMRIQLFGGVCNYG